MSDAAGHSEVVRGISRRSREGREIPRCARNDTGAPVFISRGARLVACICCLCLGAAGAGYVNDFSAAEVGKPPADFAGAGGGAFTVVERDGNKVLELPGEPLETFGMLFGPQQPPEATAWARIQSESTGRRFPEFGIGLGDIGGYKLMFLPGQKKLELRKGDDAVASADLPEAWASGSWLALRLQVRKTAEAKWKIEAKGWPAAKPEPHPGQVFVETTDAPPAGRASLWGIPFSGKPIRFDDLRVEPGR